MFLASRGIAGEADESAPGCITSHGHKSKNGSFDYSMVLKSVFNDKETPGFFLCYQ